MLNAPSQDDVTRNSQVKGDGQQELIDTGQNNPISIEEVRAALCKTKNGKSCGFDEIPVETLRNETDITFLHKPFHNCFEKGVNPSILSKGIIQPIPKNSTHDVRDPLSYRGITLAFSVYKLYCSVLNMRLSTWAEVNQFIHDEQNGFRNG